MVSPTSVLAVVSPVPSALVGLPLVTVSVPVPLAVMVALAEPPVSVTLPSAPVVGVVSVESVPGGTMPVVATLVDVIVVPPLSPHPPRQRTTPAAPRRPH